MAWFPGAIRKPVAKHRTPMAAYNRVNLHVAVSEAASLFGYFNRSDVGVCSHFYVRKDGTVEQYVDTTYRAAADYQGNDATISVETQGGVTNAQGEPWTDAQVTALARIFAWAVATHGIAARLATDSRIGATSKGLSWHRLGIDPWRVSGGMRYSTSAGKVCPGNAKIAQIPTVLARSATTMASNPTTIPGGSVGAPTGTLPDPLAQEDDMQESDFKRINEMVYNLWKAQEMANILEAAATRAVAAAAGTAVWDHRLAKADETPVAAKAWLVDTRIIVAQLPAMVVAALPPGGTGGATLAQVEAAVKLVLAKLTGTLTLKSV